MDEHFKHDDQDKKEQQQIQPQKKERKNWGQTVLSGVIGSVLTIGAIFYTPLGEQLVSPQIEKGEGEQTKQTEQTEEVPNVKSAAKEVSTDSLADMVEETSKAIVGISNYKQGEQNPFVPSNGGDVQGGSGSGVIIKQEDDDAYVVTNNHVVEGADRLEVSLANGETVEATLIGSDALSDLAVLRISNEHVESVLEFGDSDELRAGDQVVAIGNPLGVEFSRSVTQGIISAVDRTIETKTSAGQWDLQVIQTDAAINPGNSGGPLINMNGEVIGINSLKIAAGGVEGLGFAIPSNDVLPLVEEMMKNGSVARPYLGISMTDVDKIPRSYLGELPKDVTEGVAVADVDANSPAGKAGMKPGDIIVKMDGEQVQTTEDLRSALYKQLKVGDKVTLEIYRGKEKMNVDVTLSSNTLE